jgi:diaminopimelate epimerase
MRRGLVGDAVEVVMPGGSLRIRRAAGGSLVQSGPAKRVYCAEVDLADL